MKTIKELETVLLEGVEKEAQQAAHIELAKSNCAMHMTLLGISRWTSGNSLAAWQLANIFGPLSHIEWLEATNRNFQSWLQAGGFAQPEQDTLTASSAEDIASGASGAGIGSRQRKRQRKRLPLQS
jgi:hypothetical protein